jgi:hypothetical protein
MINKRLVCELEDLILTGNTAGVLHLVDIQPELLQIRVPVTEESWVHVAAKKGNLELIKFFYDRGVPLNLLNSHSECALSAATRIRDVESVKWLIDHGADPKISDWCMIDAVSKGQLEIVRLFVEHGADINFPAVAGHQLWASGCRRVPSIDRCRYAVCCRISGPT